MRAAIGLFLAALVCIAVAWWVSMLPGAVTATIAGTTLTTSTPFALLLLAILFGLLYLVIRLIAWVISIPSRLRRRGGNRSRIKGELALNRALIALAADDAGAARREADKGRRLLGDTPLTLLIAAQAGRSAGREDEAAALYEQLAERKDSRLLGLRGLMRIAVERQDWERATTLAVEAEKAHPGAAWLRDERRYMAQATGEWREALRLATPENKAALAVIAAQNETDPKVALPLAKQAFDAEPSLAPAAIAYATALRKIGKQRQAQDVLRQAWSTKPHPDLATAFVVDAGDKLAQAREMAVLVRSNPDTPESYIAIGHAALEAGLTGEAPSPGRACPRRRRQSAPDVVAAGRRRDDGGQAGGGAGRHAAHAGSGCGSVLALHCLRHVVRAVAARLRDLSLDGHRPLAAAGRCRRDAPPPHRLAAWRRGPDRLSRSAVI